MSTTGTCPNPSEHCNTVIDSEPALSPRHRVTSRFHSHYDSQSASVSVSAVRIGNSKPSGALDSLSHEYEPSAAHQYSFSHDNSKHLSQQTGLSSISGVYDSSKIVIETKRATELIALGNGSPESKIIFDENGGHRPIPNTNLSASVRSEASRNNRGASTRTENRARTSEGSPSAAGQSPSSLYPRRVARSISGAVSRVLDEEAHQIEHENQMASAIALHHLNEARKEQEKIERRLAKSKNSKGMASRSLAVASQGEEPISSEGTRVLDKEADIIALGATTTTLCSSVSSQSECEADISNSESYVGIPSEAHSDSVSIASDAIGSDGKYARYQTTNVSPPIASKSGLKSSDASAKKDGFWGGLFKKDIKNTAASENGAKTHGYDPSASGTRHTEENPAAAASPSTSHNSFQKQPINVGFRSKVVLIGDQGSGKTSLKACFTPNLLKTLPEVNPSTQSSSSLYFFRAESTKLSHQRKTLAVTIVDSGPVPITSGVQTFCDDGTLFVMTLSLAGVKQKPAPKSLNPFGPKAAPEPIIFDGDKHTIRSYLRTIASVAPRNSAFVMVGTCLDLLSDTSQGAVESVINEIRKIVMAELALEPYQLMFRGCFAVSCVDHKVISDLRPTGPRYISDLWTLLCETMMKDAVSNHGGVVLSSPQSFGWEQDAVSGAIGILEESGESITGASFAPQIGNVSNALLAKFISVGTQKLGNSSESFQWLSNTSTNPASVVDNSSIFTHKMLKQCSSFPDVDTYTIATSQLNVGSVVAVVDEHAPRPCRSLPPTHKSSTCTQHDTDFPKSQRDLLCDSSNEYSPTAILYSDEEVSQLMLLRTTCKSTLFLSRAKNELNCVVTPLGALRRNMFAMGVTSKGHFYHILSKLEREGEIKVFRRQPEGRDDTVLFQPHLISRAISIVLKTAQLSGYPINERRKIIPAVDAEECQAADPENKLSCHGLLSDILIIALGSCLSTLGKTRSESAELLRYILIASDFMIQCQEPDRRTRLRNSEIVAESHGSVDVSSFDEVTCGVSQVNERVTANTEREKDIDSSVVSTTARITSYFNRPKKSKLELLTDIDCSFNGIGHAFVVPSLVKKKIGRSQLQVLESLLNCTPYQLRRLQRFPGAPRRGGRFSQMMNANPAIGLVADQHCVTVYPAPPFLRHKLFCRLARFVRSPEYVFSDAVWLCSPQLMCRCLIAFQSSSNSFGDEIQLTCVSDGKLNGNLEFFEQIISEIRNIVKYELRGSTIHFKQKASKIPSTEGLGDSQFASTHSLEQLDDMFMTT